MDFDSLGLDLKLLRALKKRGFDHPMPVQAEAVPKALEGRDIVARARTGSGKTLAYLLPALHRVLTSGMGRAGWQALILVPTRELCDQVKDETSSLIGHCGENIKVTALLAEGNAARSVASTAGQVVVSTPARIAALLRQGILSLRSLERSLKAVVFDEADLLLSYGYEQDIAEIAPAIPRSCQTMLMSATTSDDIDKLTKLILHDPISLDLLAKTAPEFDADDITNPAGMHSLGAATDIDHRSIDLPAACAVKGRVTETMEKLLYLLALLRLKLVQSKVLIFVNTVEIGMKVRIFLDAFGLRCSLLSAELPLNSRHHILQEFNKGLFDYLIATDDLHGSGHGADADSKSKKIKNNRRHDDSDINNDINGGGSGGSRKKKNIKRKTSKDEEFGVTRGIDFKGVNTVINFDMPGTVDGYVHRVGRTGRAGRSGTAVSLFAPSDAAFKRQLEASLGSGTTQQQHKDIDNNNNNNGDISLPHNTNAAAAAAPISIAVTDTSSSFVTLKSFDNITTSAVESLRYRSEDVARSITKSVIKEAAAKDLKAELLNSKRLASFFEERPADLQLLRHDRPIAASATAGAAAPHLKHLPAYLRDPTLQGSSFVGNGGGGYNNARGRIAKKRKAHAGIDPVKGFVKAPKKGRDRLEEPTEMELRAEEAGKKERKALKKKGGIETSYVAKKNVRRFKGRKR